MSEQEPERGPGRDELAEEQQGKGYGEDEGERDDALEDDADSPTRG
jgi:hypothetical protein